jgi:Lipocalin-like domain
MNLNIRHFIAALVLIFGMVLPNENAAAQETAKDLVGTWTLVSITIEREGKKADFYGPNPLGQAMYDANGRVSSIITRSDLPKFASNNRQLGTPEENAEVVQGSIAYFGTYTVDEAAKTVTYHIESSSFPNWKGIKRISTFKISGDELTFTNPNSSIGVSNEAVWKRAK